jgi:hypothetical protein
MELIAKLKVKATGRAYILLISMDVVASDWAIQRGHYTATRKRNSRNDNKTHTRGYVSNEGTD